LTAAQAARVGSLLDAAGMFNPDREVDLLRGQVLLGEGQRRPALRVFEGVTRDEPMNIEAWVLVAQTAYGNGPLIDRALARVGQLDRVGASARR
jgi:predicted Zn-dependent protease